MNKKSLFRYELSTNIPPADALKAIADALGMSADYLLSDDTVTGCRLVRKVRSCTGNRGEAREVINNFLDMAIRDYKAKKAYSTS